MVMKMYQSFVSLVLLGFLGSSAASVGSFTKVKAKKLQIKVNGTVHTPKIHGGAARTLRGHHHSPAIVALQAKDSTHLQSSEQEERRAQKREHSYFSHLLSTLHRQAVKKQKQHHKRVNLCDGNQYQWMVQARQGCKDSFGEDSTWDNDRGEGACRTAWNDCNSDFAGTCCTQPEGPRNMEAYCAREDAQGDRACAVQGQMGQVQGVLGGIRDQVGLLDARPAAVLDPTLFHIIEGECRLMEGGRCVVSPNWPDNYEDESECEIRGPTRGVVFPRVKVVTRQFDTEGCCDRLTVANRVFGGGSRDDGPDIEIEDGENLLEWTSDFSASSTGWKVCAEDVPPAPPPPPPPLCLAPGQVAAGPAGPGPSPGPSPVAQVYIPCPAPSMPDGLSPVPSPGPAPGPGPARHGPRKPTKLETQCTKLADLVRKAAVHIDAVRKWSQHDGIVASGPAPAPAGGHGHSLLSVGLAMFTSSAHMGVGGTSEAKDPDLTFAMQKVLTIGSSLDSLRDGSFCGKKMGSSDDDDGDDNDDDEEGEAEGDEASGAAGSGAAGSEAAALGADGEKEVAVNGTAIAGLLEFEGEMMGAVDKFDSSVHPHGKKWWRYRYEYTIVESLVLAFSVMFLYFIMYLLHGASFFDKFKFYNIGLTARLYRYAWAYFVFHAAALMIMVTLSYMLYMPWGKYNVFDYGAQAFHEAVDGRANIPFLGYSWLIMALDVQFQLFVCFSLYAVFIVFVTRNFAKALEDWKSMSEQPFDSASRLPINEHHYKEFADVMTHRVRENPSFHRLFADTRLRFLPVTGVDSNRTTGFNDFKLHLYLTDSLGKALEYLVEVSWRANAFLAVCALIVCGLAHHYQLAFMYFLPVFIVLGFILFLYAYWTTRALRDNDHTYDLDNITVHAYCRSVQLVLYAVFFSLSRLLLSNDIFTDYPKVYLAAFIATAVTMLLAYAIAGEVMKATICAIVLPHESQEDRFRMNLQHVVYWHTTENCHECGVRQAPSNASLNREWAGQNHPKKKPGEPEEPPPSAITSGREFSFR